ncbi:hypothetical protein GGX14DRAFT_388594 [Mycena pura]|uniref:Uncharacterized protein n=1 Tax=Mycena pura TaxID=153505 RepID=A0AAD6YJ84_9AGAR|nr:hypothetical protein GGX14DRAFT_388594 [Mycena pura]
MPLGHFNGISVIFVVPGYRNTTGSQCGDNINAYSQEHTIYDFEAQVVKVEWLLCDRYANMKSGNLARLLTQPTGIRYVDLGVNFTGIIEPEHGATYAFVLPDVDAGEFVGQVGITPGGSNSLIVVGWVNETDIRGCPRFADKSSEVLVALCPSLMLFLGADYNATSYDSSNVTGISSALTTPRGIVRAERPQNPAHWRAGPRGMMGTFTNLWGETCQWGGTRTPSLYTNGNGSGIFVTFPADSSGRKNLQMNFKPSRQQWMAAWTRSNF